MVPRIRLILMALCVWGAVAAVPVAPIAAQGPLGGKTAADRHKDGHSKLGGVRRRSTRTPDEDRGHRPNDLPDHDF